MTLPVSIESQISDKLVAIIDAIPEVKTVNFDEVKLAISEFRPHELPAVQFWDTGGTVEHERGRIIMNWGLSLEIVMRSKQTGVVNQKDLWDLRRAIQRAIWEQPNLGIPGVIHSVYTGTITDLHSVEPHYIARLDFDIRFYDDLTGSC